MSFSASRNRRGRAGLAALAIAVTGVFAATPASAAPAEGTAKIVLSKQQKGNGLVAQGIRVSPLTLPVADLELGQASTIRTTGSLKLSLGKHDAHLRELVIESSGRKTAVSAKLGKQRLTVLRAKGAVQLDPTSLKLDDARLSLTGKGAKALKGKLGLEQLSAGKIGTLSLDAALPTPVTPVKTEQPAEQPKPKDLDPYFEQCGVKATSEAAGNLPGATDPPSLSSKDAVAASQLDWGFKESLRSYVVFGAGGSLKAVDGATANGGPPVVSSFDFPVTGGEYDGNNPIDMNDDQAVVEGSGTALFCATGHKFRVALSNPTVVIDGGDSRVVADVDTNLTGVWTPAQRVDLAELNLDGITPFYNHSGSEVTWSDIPATLTEAGADAICGDGSSPCSYTEGTELDPIDVTANTPYDTSDLNALATYVAAELPFPILNSAEGGCTLPTASSGPHTIDAGQVENPTNNPAWKGNAAPAAAQPDLSAKTALTGGDFKWGLRGSLRGTINTTGEFNLFGTTASNTPYFGNGPGSVPRTTPAPGQMGSTAGRHFIWPAASSSTGFYDAGGAGNTDDRLVLRTTGRVAFCQSESAQAYGTVLSNPTIVIDGTKSRITIDMATRYRLSWVRGVVDIATLNLSDPGVVINESDSSGTTTVTWSFPAATGTPAVGPVTLTADGEAVLNMLAKNTYVAGLGLDAVTISAAFPEGI
jgi:hypothetical protein